MQYLLTTEEFAGWHDSLAKAEQANKELIQRLCTELANNKAILFWKHSEARIWGCILTKTADYCDCCPVKDDCPCEHKEFSK